MNFAELKTWVEAHPGESVLIGGAGVIFLLWLFGFFSSSTTAADTGQSNLAAAYYAAEAQQAVVGGQIQEANIAATAATAQANIAAGAATTINSQNTTTAQTINGQNTSTLVTLGDQALSASQNNNATLLQAQQTHDTAVLQMNNDNNQATLMQTVLGTIVPEELMRTGGAAFDFSNFGLGSGAVNTSGVVSINDLLSQGYSQAQANTLVGLPGAGG